MDLDRKALELKESRTPYCVATVVKVDGSSPGRVGAKMIVTRGECFGTVGGGSVEHQAIKDAREALRLRQPRTEGYDLTEQGIQPCGGRVEIFLEPVAPARRMVVFGAGHIAEKLCPMLVEMGFDLTLVDERRERLALEAFEPIDDKVNRLPGDFLPELEFTDDLHLICITHQHEHDEGIVRFCLDKPYRYLGLISSRSKWRMFSERFSSEGFSSEQLARVSTPIGLDIGAETPVEIAIAIAAQLVQLCARPEDFERGTCHFPRGGS